MEAMEEKPLPAPSMGGEFELLSEQNLIPGVGEVNK